MLDEGHRDTPLPKFFVISNVTLFFNNKLAYQLLSLNSVAVINTTAQERQNEIP